MSQLEDIEARDLGVDGEFRAEMRHAQAISDRAYLLSVVAEQAAKLDAVRELHDFHFQGDAKKCDTCQVSGYALPWPCETVDALEARA